MMMRSSRRLLRLATRRDFTRRLNTQISEFLTYREKNGCAIVQLNRPKALNAINEEIYISALSLLKELQREKSLVIFKGNERVFSAGGDMKDMSQVDLEKTKFLFGKSLNTFRLVHNYEIPYVPLITGLCFGGGVNYSIAAKRHRVVTETTKFAMPEVKIGFFTDNGSSYTLSRLANNVGLYIALTGAPIKGYDLVKIGLADHYVQSSRLAALEDALSECGTNAQVEAKLSALSAQPPAHTELDQILPHVAECFDGDSVEEIIENLQLNGSDWAKSTVKIMSRMSPTSLKICHKLLKVGKHLPLDECLKMEFRVGLQHVVRSDMQEGVRALLVDKDNRPKWNPRMLSEVDQEHVDRFFSLVKDRSELSFD